MLEWLKLQHIFRTAGSSRYQPQKTTTSPIRCTKGETDTANQKFQEKIIWRATLPTALISFSRAKFYLIVLLYLDFKELSWLHAGYSRNHNQLVWLSSASSEQHILNAHIRWTSNCVTFLLKRASIRSELSGSSDSFELQMDWIEPCTYRILFMYADHPCPLWSHIAASSDYFYGWTEGYVDQSWNLLRSLSSSCDIDSKLEIFRWVTWNCHYGLKHDEELGWIELAVPWRRPTRLRTWSKLLCFSNCTAKNPPVGHHATFQITNCAFRHGRSVSCLYRFKIDLLLHLSDGLHESGWQM